MELSAIIKKIIIDDLYICPRCNNPVAENITCDNCGQPLKWSESKK